MPKREIPPPSEDVSLGCLIAAFCLANIAWALCVLMGWVRL